MFDIGMSELLLIGIVALIVVGPKDLPALFHTLGRFTAKMRSLGREFTNAMNAAARESGVDDVAKGLKGVANPKKFGLDKLNEAADRFDKWEPSQAKAPPKPAADPERAADIEKIRAATEKAGQARLDREAAAKAEAETAKPAAKAETTPAQAKTAPARKPAAKKATAKASGAKPATRTASAKSAAATKPVSKPAAKKAPVTGGTAKAGAAKPAKAKAAKAAAPKADDA